MTIDPDRAAKGTRHTLAHAWPGQSHPYLDQSRNLARVFSLLDEEEEGIARNKAFVKSSRVVSVSGIVVS
jgi:inhibitor of KinA sporulation pathway (predicted exonuclease)